MLPLLLLIAAIPADHPRTHERTATVEVHVLAVLTEAEAKQLQGRRVRFLAEPCNNAFTQDGFLMYECHGMDMASRTLYLFPPGPESLPERFKVEAELEVIHHRGGKGMQVFTELRLTRARLVK